MREIDLGNPATMSMKIADVLFSVSKISESSARKAADPKFIEELLLGGTIYKDSNVFKLGNIVNSKVVAKGTRKVPTLISNVTGQVFDSLSEAFDVADAMGIVNYIRLSNDPKRAVGNQSNFEPLLIEIHKIGELLRTANAKPKSKKSTELKGIGGLGKLLTEFRTVTKSSARRGIDNPFEISVLSLKNKFSGNGMDKSINHFREGQKSGGLIQGLLVHDIDRYHILQYGLPSIKLNEKEIGFLRSYSGAKTEEEKRASIEFLKGERKDLGKIKLHN